MAEHLRAGVRARIDSIEKPRGKRAVVHVVRSLYPTEFGRAMCPRLSVLHRCSTAGRHRASVLEKPQGSADSALRYRSRQEAEGPPARAPPLPLFSQVFILKVVKVLCFDTLLQVLILKVVSRGLMWCRLEASFGSHLQSYSALLLRLDSSKDKLIAISLRHPSTRLRRKRQPADEVSAVNTALPERSVTQWYAQPSVLDVSP